MVVMVDRVTRGNSHRLHLERVIEEVRKNGPDQEGMVVKCRVLSTLLPWKFSRFI